MGAAYNPSTRACLLAVASKEAGAWHTALPISSLDLRMVMRLYALQLVLVWDATFPDTLAPSYSSLATRKVGVVAEEAERRKKAKYSHLESSYCFIPVGVDTRCV